MKLKYRFIFQPVGQRYIGTAVGDDARKFNGMLQLNGTGYRIVQLIQEGKSEEAIVEQMANEYDGDHDLIAQSVGNVIAQLNSEGVLE